MSIRRALVSCSLLLAVCGPAAVVGTTPARADSRICVALVVDFADLGGGVHSTCAQVAQGSTGVDVLQAAGHRLTVCSDGIIGEIDGKPANGCQTKDSTHYWSYWHRAPGSTRWTYSTEGPATYEPANRSTEGWVWQSGSAKNQQPTDVPYADICGSTPTPRPATTTTMPRHRSATTSGSQHKTVVAPATPPATTGAAAAAATSDAPSTVGRTTHRSADRSLRAAATRAAATPTATASSPTARTTVVTTGRAGKSAGGASPALGIALAVAAAAGLGAAGWWRTRRSREPM
ncbi:MAG TPA: hypothetical protein VFT62_03545 [Mycobacteriales bacterium]|nr:hypothetical protein [Mycobacteriales bacterium]